MWLPYGELGLPYHIGGCHVEIGKIGRHLRRVGDFLRWGFFWIERHAGYHILIRKDSHGHWGFLGIHRLERLKASKRAFLSYAKVALVF